MLLAVRVLVPALTLLLLAQLRLILVLLHLLVVRLVGLLVRAVFAASLLEAALEDLFEARFERFFDLALGLTLELDRIGEAFEQVHRVAVCLHVVYILPAEHVQLDTVST